MAAKQPADPLKVQYKSLVKLNQKLKNICDVYYISYNNMVYMHSLVPFIEKIAIVNDSLDISLYTGIMYLPNQLFEFTRDAKITKLTAVDLQQSIVLGQNEGNTNIKLNKVYIPNGESKEEDIIKINILPKMYSKLPLILNDIKDYNFIDISEEIITDILNNKIVTISDNSSGLFFDISKNIFSSIKKGDTIQYTLLPLKDEKLQNKSYVLYRKYTEEMTIYTMIAYFNYLIY